MIEIISHESSQRIILLTSFMPLRMSDARVKKCMFVETDLSIFPFIINC